MVKVNFRDDWRAFLERDLVSLGLKYDDQGTLEENTIAYLNARRRIIPRRKRLVHESKELRIPPQHLTDYAALKGLICEGGDLSPYLSCDIQKNRADKSDAILNNWGFHHLHFSPARHRDVLFVFITDTDVFVIQSLPHGGQYPETWVDIELLRIMHENWPDEAAGKIVGIHGESLTPAQRVNLRKNNVNFATTMPDGTVYMAQGGGVSASGRCILDVRDSAVILSRLTWLQGLVEQNEANLRSALGLPDAKELWIRIKFENGEGRLYEANGSREIQLILNTQPPNETNIKRDLEAGRLDSSIQRALDDEKNGRTRQL